VSEEGPDIVHSTPDARKNIISIVNSMWDTGIAAGMETLSSIIAVNFCSAAWIILLIYQSPIRQFTAQIAISQQSVMPKIFRSFSSG
jgi:hypothetical protein